MEPRNTLLFRDDDNYFKFLEENFPSSFAKDSPCSISCLPKEIWFQIAQFLSPKQLKPLRLTCHWFRILVFPLFRLILPFNQIIEYEKKCKEFNWKVNIYGVLVFASDENFILNLKCLPNSIRFLDLSQCKKITNSHLEILPTYLVELNLSWCKGLSDFRSLKKFVNLENLNLESCSVSNINLKELPSNLKSLNLSWCGSITHMEIQSLSSLHKLEELHLEGNYQLTNQAIEALPSSLTSLNLSQFKHFNDKCMQAISLLPLKKLNLSFCESWNDIHLLPNTLTYLNLSKCHQIESKDLAHLPVSLIHLNLLGCYKIRDEGLIHLSKLTNLTFLKLEKCFECTNTGLSYLPAESLRQLILPWNDHITDKGIQSLISRNTKIAWNITFGTQTSLLYWSCFFGYLDILQHLLLKHQPSSFTEKEIKQLINQKNDRENRTLLFIACQNQRFDIMEFLIQLGADVNEPAFEGLTPLMIASKNKNQKIVELLLNAGARVNDLDAQGRTALDHLKEDNNETLSSLLKPQTSTPNFMISSSFKCLIQ